MEKKIDGWPCKDAGIESSQSYKAALEELGLEEKDIVDLEELDEEPMTDEPAERCTETEDMFDE